MAFVQIIGKPEKPPIYVLKLKLRRTIQNAYRISPLGYPRLPGCFQHLVGQLSHILLLTDVLDSRLYSGMAEQLA